MLRSLSRAVAYLGAFTLGFALTDKYVPDRLVLEDPDFDEKNKARAKRNSTIKP